MEEALEGLCEDVAMLGSDGLRAEGLRRCKWGYGRAGRPVASDRSGVTHGRRGPLARALDTSTAGVWKALHDVLLLEEMGFPDPDAKGTGEASVRAKVRGAWDQTVKGHQGIDAVDSGVVGLVLDDGAGTDDDDDGAKYLRVGARLSVAVAVAQRGYPDAESLQKVVVDGGASGGRGAESRAALSALVWLTREGPVSAARARRRLCLAAAAVMLEHADARATREAAGAERVALAQMAVAQLESVLRRKGLANDRDAAQEYLTRFAVQVAGKGAPLPPYPHDPPPPDDPMQADPRGQEAGEGAQEPEYIREEGLHADDHARLWRRGRAAHDARVRASMHAQRLAHLKKIARAGGKASVEAMTPYELWMASDPVQRRRHQAARDAADRVARGAAHVDRLDAALARWLSAGGRTSSTS